MKNLNVELTCLALLLYAKLCFFIVANARLSGLRPTCHEPIAALSISHSPSTPAFFTSSIKTASAIGERQILPKTKEARRTYAHYKNAQKYITNEVYSEFAYPSKWRGLFSCYRMTCLRKLWESSYCRPWIRWKKNCMRHDLTFDTKHIRENVRCAMWHSVDTWTNDWMKLLFSK